jgi:hypothetical protein
MLCRYESKALFFADGDLSRGDQDVRAPRLSVAVAEANAVALMSVANAQARNPCAVSLKNTSFGRRSARPGAKTIIT